ncbi:DUF2752 domain-containing protein [bacterium]|nr:DUF2752 domain-containing protein [bacterium]
MLTFLQQPVLAMLIRERNHAAVLLIAACILFGFALFGVSLWVCPVWTCAGIPCPGCGLGRAMVLFIRGEVIAALELHAFAPVFCAGGVVVFLGAVLPARQREGLYRAVKTAEMKSGITMIVLMLFLLYWGVRFFV